MIGLALNFSIAYAQGETAPSYLTMPGRVESILNMVTVGPARFNGTGRIGGKIRALDVIAPNRTVRLYHQQSGVLVKTMTSDAGGDYMFENIDELQDYYVVALDDLGVYDPAISATVDLNP